MKNYNVQVAISFRDEFYPQGAKFTDSVEAAEEDCMIESYGGPQTIIDEVLGMNPSKATTKEDWKKGYSNWRACFNQENPNEDPMGFEFSGNPKSLGDSYLIK